MFDCFKLIINKVKKNQEEEETRMFDFRKNLWGHSVVFDDKPNDDNSFNLHGFSAITPREGDEFLKDFTKGTGVCVFTEVRLCSDPKDMFFGKAGLVRYAEDEDYGKLKNNGFTFFR